MAWCKLFDQDEVSMVKSNGQFRCGMVLESAEYVSSDEEDSADDETSQDRVKKGTVRVAWHPEGTEEVIEEKKLTLSDRSLLPGDIVRRLVEGHDSQRGCVLDTRVHCHLQVHGKPIVICDVDTSKLLPLARFELEPGDVYMDSWVGKIERIYETYTLRFPDGASRDCLCTRRVGGKERKQESIKHDTFTVSDNRGVDCDRGSVVDVRGRCESRSEDDDLSFFEDVCDKRDSQGCEFGFGEYYEGQQLRGELGSLEHVVWLKSTAQHSARASRKHRSREVVATVEKIVVEMVDVRWLCRGYSSSSESTTSQLLTTPATAIKGEDLKRLVQLDCFGANGYQLGDKAFYVVEPSDRVIGLDANRRYDKPAVLHSQLRRHGLLPACIRATSGTVGGVSSAVANDISCPTKCVEVESAHEKVDKKANGLATEAHNNVEISTDDDDEFQDAESDLHPPSCDEHPHDDVTAVLSVQVSRESVPHGRWRRGASSDALTGGTKSCFKSQKKKKRKIAKQKTKPAPTVLPLPKPGDKLPVEIVFTQTFADVMWQDGSVEKEIPSYELFPTHNLDELEFFPCDFIVSTNDSNSGATGVIQSVQHTGRVCKVRWMLTDAATGKSVLFNTEEEVSVYDIKEHSDLRYQLGQVVVRVDGGNSSQESTTNATELVASDGEPHTASDTLQPATGHCGKPAITNPAGGQIYRLCTDGMLEVMWADGSVSKCRPYEIYAINSEMTDDEGSFDEDDDEDDSDVDDSYGSGSSNDEWLTEDEEQISSTDVAADATSSSAALDQPAAEGATGDSTLVQIVNPTEAFAQIRSSFGKLHDLLLKLLELNRVGGGSLDDHATTVCRCLLSIYRCFRCHDRMNNTSIFNDESLVEWMAGVRTELAKRRTADAEKKAHKMSECARRHGSQTDASLRQAAASSEEPTSSTTAADEIVAETDKCVACDSASDPLPHDIPSAASVPCGPGLSNADIIAGRFKSLGAEKFGEDVRRELETALQDNVFYVPRLLAMLATLANAIDHFLQLLPIEHQARTISVFVMKNPSTALYVSTTIGLASFGDPLPKTSEECFLLVNGNGVTATPCKIEEEMFLAEWQSDDALIRSCRRLTLLIAASEATLKNLPQVVPPVPDSTEQTVEDPKISSENSQYATEIQDARNGAVDGEVGKVGNGVSAMDGDGTVVDASDAAAVDTPAVVAVPDEPHEPDTLSTDCVLSPVSLGASKAEFNPQGLTVVDAVPSSHHFKSKELNPTDAKSFMNAVFKEMNRLRTSLPGGIFVKSFEDRMDLLSVMIQGPARTPFEDGLFFFDVQLPADYPNSPPVFHYIAYCKDRLNPNLYEDGKVCVSLLGTWSGKGTEVWHSSNSTLLQVLVSIQALILCPEPYYNEAGYERQKGSQLGLENSRLYNEMAILKLVQSMMKMVTNPVPVFEAETKLHMKVYARRMIHRLQHWLTILPPANGSGIDLASITSSIAAESNSTSLPSSTSLPLSEATTSSTGAHSSEPPGHEETLHGSCPAAAGSDDIPLPDFPLLPVSRGFQITMLKALAQFEATLNAAGLTVPWGMAGNAGTVPGILVDNVTTGTGNASVETCCIIGL